MIVSNFKYDLQQQIGVVGTSADGVYTIEVNLISFQGKEPKIDIRRWNRETDRMCKGVSLSIHEAAKLKDVLDAYFQ